MCVCVCVCDYFNVILMSALTALKWNLPTGFPTKISMQITFISSTLHASFSTLFDHWKVFVNSENHEASHHKNSTRPKLLRPSQSQEKGYCVEIYYIFSIFNFY